jgi:hypothetical protein
MLQYQTIHKEVPNMATNMSRRVFLKCAGAAALAVTASGIFTGCSPSGGGSKDTVYGVGESTQINGVNVKLLGYRQDKISGMVGNYAGKTFITVCIGLENQSEQTVKMGNTTETELAEVLKAIYNNQYETLGKSDFKMTSDSGKIGHAEIGYLTDETGLKSYGVRDNLNPKETGCIKIYAVVPSNWEQIGIQYTPYFAPNETRSFVLNRANKL